MTLASQHYNTISGLTLKMNSRVFIVFNLIAAAAKCFSFCPKNSVAETYIYFLLLTKQKPIPPHVYNIACAVNAGRWIALHQKKVGFQSRCNFAAVSKAKASGTDGSC